MLDIAGASVHAWSEAYLDMAGCLNEYVLLLLLSDPTYFNVKPLGHFLAKW